MEVEKESRKKKIKNLKTREIMNVQHKINDVKEERRLELFEEDTK